MAINGASGPRTTPRLRVASEARTTPGSSTAVGAPPALNPSAGLWPDGAGQVRMVAPTSTPAMARRGSGHHTGVPAEAELLGQRGEEPLLEEGDQLEEEVGDGRDRSPDERGQDQDLEVAARPQQGHGVGGRRRRVGRGCRRVGRRCRARRPGVGWSRAGPPQGPRSAPAAAPRPGDHHRDGRAQVVHGSPPVGRPPCRGHYRPDGSARWKRPPSVDTPVGPTRGRPDPR